MTDSDFEDADLPTITDAVLEQWELSAEQDVLAERVWSTNPLAILAVIRRLRREAAHVRWDLTTDGTWINDEGDPYLPDFDGPFVIAYTERVDA